MTYRDLFAKPPNVDVQGKNPDTDFFFKEHYSIADERESYKKQWVRLEAEKKREEKRGFFVHFLWQLFEKDFEEFERKNYFVKEVQKTRKLHY